MSLKERKGFHINKINNKSIQPEINKKSKNHIVEFCSIQENKLEALKVELAMRKTLKSQSKQESNHHDATDKFSKTHNKDNHLNSWGNNVTKNNELVCQFLKGSKNCSPNNELIEEREKLDCLLLSLNMQQFTEKIVTGQKISGLNELLLKNDHEIDEWKEIPIGFRIKLKKFIQDQCEKQNKPTHPQEKTEEIEEIIKRRKKEKLYSPISHKIIEEDDSEENEQKTNVISKQIVSNENQLIESILPKEEKESQKIICMVKYQQPQYCWNCLQKVSKTFNPNPPIPIINNRVFCSNICSEQYSKLSSLNENNKLSSSNIEKKEEEHIIEPNFDIIEHLTI